ncbi:MAG TPA: tetratricopeptide repeat protein [Ktedonobacteraceae bacterium]|nr:tetratricopeptide repeat protein [Ktedonobacteraceae bacterium]
MATRQQGQQLEDPLQSEKQKKQATRLRWLIAVVALILISGVAIFWLKETHGSVYTILPIIIFTVLSAVIGLCQWLFPISSNTPAQSITVIHPSLLSELFHSTASAAQTPQIVESAESAAPAASAESAAPPEAHHYQQAIQSGPLDKATYRGIMGIPPPTDPRSIQQREKTVQATFAQLCETGVSALVLTGIGGVGKSTLAALIYQYAEAQRAAGHGTFTAESIWLNIDPAVTLADLAGNLFQLFEKPLPDFSRLSLQHQAMALFNVLNTTEQPRLIVLDQFENLLDWSTGRALADRPGVGEWLDAINSQPCASRILMTSRPWPLGTHEYPPTCMQEYYVPGLDVTEGIDLLRKLHIEASDAQLGIVVERCQGHAYALALLASLLHTRNLSLETFLKDPLFSQVWTGNVTGNLLDYIFQKQLKVEQRQLLLAFSVYREPVTIGAAHMVFDTGNTTSRAHLHGALDVLLNQRLLQAAGDGSYQLHALVTNYAQGHFDDTDEQHCHQLKCEAHARAAVYYAQQVALRCPPREKRRKISHVQPLIEEVWQLCQAELWPDAFKLMEHEGLFGTLKRAGGNAILLELYQQLSLEKWQPTPEQHARVANTLGVVYRLLGRLDKAREQLEVSLYLYRAQGNHSGEARALNDLGRVYAEMGYREKAQSEYHVALRISQQQGDTWGTGIAFNNLGYVYIAMGQNKQAQDYYEQALVIFRDLGDNLGEAATLNNLGRVYEDLQQREQAQEYYRQALSIFHAEGDRRGEAWSLNNLGKACRKLGQHEQALGYLQQAYVIRREIDRKGEGRTLRNMGTVYEVMGQSNKALEYYRQALAIAQEVEDHEGQGKTMRNLGKLYLDLQRYDAALAFLTLAENILHEIDSTYYNESLRGIETLRETVGDDEFTTLMASVEPRAQQITEQALSAS